jgi:hypothetical protein
MGIVVFGPTRPIPNDFVRSASPNAVDDYMLKTASRENASDYVPARIKEHVSLASPPYTLDGFRDLKRTDRTRHAHENTACIHRKILLSKYFIAFRCVISRPFVLSGSCEQSVREPSCQSQITEKHADARKILEY